MVQENPYAPPEVSFGLDPAKKKRIAIRNVPVTTFLGHGLRTCACAAPLWFFFCSVVFFAFGSSIPAIGNTISMRLAFVSALGFAVHCIETGLLAMFCGRSLTKQRSAIVFFIAGSSARFLEVRNVLVVLHVPVASIHGYRLYAATHDYLCVFLLTVWILRLCERRNILLTAISATLCFAAATPVLMILAGAAFLPWISPASDHWLLKFAPGWLEDCLQVVLLALTLWIVVRVSLWVESRQSPGPSATP